MKRYSFLFLLFAWCILYVSSIAVETKAPDEKTIAAVRDGSSVRAKVSDWGFDPDDATDSFQRAINSGVKTLVVDRLASPWVVRPLTLRSDLELVFEEGAEVRAKAGEFHGISDSLFTLNLCENVVLRGEGRGATIRMRKADYHTDAYKQAEWRHGINMHSVTNVRIENLTIAETGGDGIYLGVARRGVPCSRVVVKKVVCDGNNRQGISVISAVDLLIEDTVMKNTSGTAPQAGIDFEPNQESEQLENCVMRNCVSENNAGSGFDFYLPNLSAKSGTLGITLENCVSRNNRGSAVALTLRNEKGLSITGLVAFKNCVFENDPGGIAIRSTSVEGAKVVFENTKMVRELNGRTDIPEPMRKRSPIILAGRWENEEPFGNIDFGHFVLKYDSDAPFLTYLSSGFEERGLNRVAGRFEMDQNGQKSVAVVDEAWCREHYPAVMTRPIAPVERGKTVFVPQSPEGVKTQYAAKKGPAGMRGRNTASYLCYAEKGQNVELRFRIGKVGHSTPDKCTVTVKTPAGKEKTYPMVPDFAKETIVTWTAPQTGNYEVTAAVKSNAVQLLKTNVAIAGIASKMHLISSRGTYYFWVPEGTKEFAVRIVGEGVEMVDARIASPDGEVWKRENISAIAAFVTKENEPPKPGLWSVTFTKPVNGVMEDFLIDIVGIPALITHRPELILIGKD